jgi:formate dehydrogenase maturation protein FdhE
MTLDPQTAATLAALFMAVGWTMTFAGLKKNVLEQKQRRRVCPACGRRIDGRVCQAH